MAKYYVKNNFNKLYLYRKRFTIIPINYYRQKKKIELQRILLLKKLTFERYSFNFSGI